MWGSREDFQCGGQRKTFSVGVKGKLSARRLSVWMVKGKLSAWGSREDFQCGGQRKTFSVGVKVRLSACGVKYSNQLPGIHTHYLRHLLIKLIAGTNFLLIFQDALYITFS